MQIGTVSQFRVNQSNYRTKVNNQKFCGILDTRLVKGDREGDIDKMRRNYNKILSVYGSLIVALSLILLFKKK